MARFLDLISGLGGARNPPRHRAPTARWPPAPEAHPLGGGGGSPFGGAGNVRTYTSRTGTGFTTFTIATGPINLNAGGGARAGGRAPAEGGQDNDDFNTYVLRPHVERTPFGTRITMISIRAPANQPPSVFGNLLGGMAPPQGAAAAAGNDDVHDGGRPNAPNLATSLGQLLSMLVPPGNAQMGDAVYTQEALDRIVSAMMEQNPQSNAAPPASEDAINKLEKKTVDESMLDEADGKAECTICIEELKKGDQVIYLPCKHWFHEECAHLWLREHNTCPICRAAIEAADPAAGNNNSTGGGNAQQGTGPSTGGAPSPFGNAQTPGSASGDYAPPPYPPPGQGGPPMGSGWGASQGPPPVPRGTRPAAAHTWRWSFTYPPRPSMSPNPSADRPGSRTPSGYSINLPRPRRDSLSPPASTSGSRTRQRSPTPNSWERLRDNPQEHPQPYLHRQQLHQQQREQQQQQQQQQQQSGSGGPLSWLRHQLSRASGSGPATGPGSAPGPGSGPDSRSGDDWARERRREQ
jgi:E3 ubiquitin-protein ligase RNF115/126